MTSVISADSKELECTSMSRLHRALVSIAFCLSACGVAAAQQPQLDQLRLIAPAAPGGGWDQTARVMQQVLQRTGIVRTAPVENIPGAAGTIGLALRLAKDLEVFVLHNVRSR